MRSRNVIFAAMLAMMPLGAEGADLVVWWEQGFYPEEENAVRETIAAFEQKTGKPVELVFHDQADLPEKAQAAIEAGQPPDFLFGLDVDAKIAPWAYDDRLVDLTEAVGALASMFDPDVLEASMLLNGRTGERALYALPIGRSTNHLHVWTSLLEKAGFTLPTSRVSGRRSGRFGATECRQRCARPSAATTSGVSASPCRRQSTPGSNSFSSSPPMTRSTSLARASLRSTIRRSGAG
jgi:Bacterial extracellular solute-binding protein